MTADDVLRAVSGAGGRILAIGNRLKLRAPRKVLTPELLAAAKANKPELLRRVAEMGEGFPIIGPEWLMEAVEVAKTKTEDCFLCRWILGSLKDGRLHPTGRDDGMSGELFPVAAQEQHLRLEYGIVRAERGQDDE